MEPINVLIMMWLERARDMMLTFGSESHLYRIQSIAMRSGVVTEFATSPLTVTWQI